MLKHNEPYRYAKPGTVHEKLSDIRRKAGQGKAGSRLPNKRKAATTTAKNQAGPTSRLNDVYGRAGLPSVRRPDQLPAGEQRMLAEVGVAEFAQAIHEPGKAKKPQAEKKAEAVACKA